MADTEQLQKLNDLLKNFRFAMLTTRGHGGELRAHPLTVQETEFDGDLWFVIGRHASAVEDIAHHDAVGVSFSSSDAWLSISGTAHVVDDLAKLRELWGPTLEAWFPNGPEDPEVTLLKVDAEGAEYWDSPGGRIASAIAFVKHKVTGERYEGDNDTIEL